MARVTQGGAKELLPLGDHCVIDRVVEGLWAAGCTRVVVVAHPRKADLWAALASRSGVQLALQPRALGLAHAVACAGIRGEPALVAMADVVHQRPDASRSLVEAIQAGAWGGVVVREVPAEAISRYGVVEHDFAGRASRLIEKPALGTTASRSVIAGRFAFSAAGMEAIQRACIRLVPDAPELYLTPILSEAVDRGEFVHAEPLVGDLYDCGSPEGYQAAVQAYP